jgi:hypothetical protein
MPSNPPLNDVTTFLSSAGLGLTVGTNLFASLLPDQPDAAVAVFEYMPAPSDFTMGSGSLQTALPAIEESRVQIMCRDIEANYNTNQATIEAIYRAMVQMSSSTIGGTFYQRFEPMQRPFFLHRDEKRRVYHVNNYMILRTPF